MWGNLTKVTDSETGAQPTESEEEMDSAEESNDKIIHEIKHIS